MGRAIPGNRNPLLKILHIIIGLEIGGAELMLKRLIGSHHGHPDFSHSVISLGGVGKVGEQLRARGVAVRALNMQSALDLPRVLWQLARMIRVDQPDIVQTWMYHADLLGGLAARWAGNRRVIWGIRTTDVKTGVSRSTALVRWACARLSSWVPRTIVCAAEASRRAHVAAGYDAGRMVVVPNGFDLAGLVANPDQRAALRAQCGFGVNDVVVGSLGRFNPDKDQENFARAAGRLARQNERARFLLVGRDLDAGNSQLARWLAQTGHADRFVLLGERADVPVCLAAMDIFCLSSRTEGFPNVVGEAMAMGLPCVVTDVGDAAILVGDTGVVVPKEDSEALAGGVRQVLEMAPEVRLQLGQKAKARVTAEYSLNRARERFEKLYRQVVAEDGR